MFTIRKWWLLLIAALVPLSLSAQTTDGLMTNKFIAATRGSTINLLNTGIVYHQMTWHVVGTVSACTVALDSSANGSSWSAGGVIAGQTCTTDGQATITNAAVNYVSMNMTAFTATAGSYVTVTWTGWVSSPSSGGGVASCTTAGGVAYENGTANVLTCDANLTWVSQTLSLNGVQNIATTPTQDIANSGVAFLADVTGADTGGSRYVAIYGQVAPTLTGTSISGITGIFGGAFPFGTGSYTAASLVSGIQGGIGNGGSGTIGIGTAFSTAPVTNSGGGSITDLIGYFGGDQGGTGTTLNAAFYAAAQTAGAANWGFYSVSANKDHFGAVTAVSINSTTDVSAYQIAGNIVLALPGSDTNSIAGGYKALINQGVGAYYNSAFGYQALLDDVSGASNSAFGFDALSLDTGASNAAFGNEALYNNSAGASNSAFGMSALYNNTTDSGNSAFGFQTLLNLNVASAHNSAFGYQALNTNVSGTNDTAVGYNALFNATSAGNAAVGDLAGYALTSGADGTFLGSNAGNGNGGAALTGANNTLVGFSAAFDIAGAAHDNTTLGYESGLGIQTGNFNTFVGSKTVQNGASELTGSNNTSVGYASLFVLASTGAGNTAVGYEAGIAVTSGTNNTLLGQSTTLSGATDANEIAIGSTVTGAGSNTTVIGNSSTTDSYFGGSTSGASNIHGKGYYSGATAGITDAGLCSATFGSTLGLVTTCTAASDPRLKIFGTYSHGLDAIMQIEPIHFHWNKVGLKAVSLSSKYNPEQIGFSAKNIQQAIPEAVGYERHDGIDYLSLPEGDRPIVAALVNAVKEQQKEIEALDAKILALENK